METGERAETVFTSRNAHVLPTCAAFCRMKNSAGEKWGKRHTHTHTYPPLRGSAEILPCCGLLLPEYISPPRSVMHQQRTEPKRENFFKKCSSSSPHLPPSSQVNRMRFTYRHGNDEIFHFRSLNTLNSFRKQEEPSTSWCSLEEPHHKFLFPWSAWWWKNPWWAKSFKTATKTTAIKLTFPHFWLFSSVV